MASAIIRKPCIKCDKSLGITTCGGCQQWFCIKHFNEHRQELGTHMDNVGQEHDLLQRDLIKENITYSLLTCIDDWEQKSIQRVQIAADEARVTLQKYLDQTKNQLKTSLCEMSQELQSSRVSDDYTEVELNKWTEQLEKLRTMLEKPSIIDNIDDDQTEPMIRLIQVKERPTTIRHVPNIGVNTRWARSGVIVAGGNGEDNGLNQLSIPHGLYVDDDQTVYIADCGNHRITEWNCGVTSGRVVAGGNGQGNRSDQLNGPADVIVDKETDSLIICDSGNRRVMQWSRQNCTSGETIISNIACWGLTIDNKRFLYVSDYEKNEVRRYRMGETDGIVVAGGNGEGHRLNQLNCPRHVSVDRDGSVFVSDTNNHRVMKWVKGAKEGIVLAGGGSKGSDLTQLYYPNRVLVDLTGAVYIADCWNHRVVRWSKGAIKGNIVVGGNGAGEKANQLKYPEGLLFDRYGNLYVVENGNNRVQRFNIEATTVVDILCSSESI